ncbi:hypothetical protein J1N35_008001 [Gossypium stocksii]|uniref:SWIM-type domain-containing protein n=1 Tax=Gossypium stocksii TaxID=47602 RepID=A0A9D3W8H1_9ROSI|nr:hypothetical protein J1N35_008001 [Gossypium stocksii]
MHNVDLSQDDALEFPDLPHRRRDRTSFSLDLGELEVGKEFSNKDSFLGALKQHSITNKVNYKVIKSKSDKFEAKCVVQDGICSWKIMASLRKMTGLWEIKKHKGLHTCVAGVSEDHPKMDSEMLATLILLTVKVDPRTSVSVLITNICSQLRYTTSYRKVWKAKQKALEKIHGGWDASYNKVWQWCQVLERYVSSCITDLETKPAYYNDRLLHGCQVFRLRRHVFPQPNICVISDRGTGILAAIERQGRYDISKDRFHEMLAVLRSVNEKGADYLCNIPFEQWTQAYDGGLRYASYKGQMQGGHVWCAKVLQEINKAKAHANTMHTVCHDRDNLWFRVTKFNRPHEGIIGGQYHVHLRNRTYDCRRFDALHYPCAHVIAACQNLRIDPMSYVDEVYKLETMYNVWRHVFPPVPDERKWPPVSLTPFKLLPDRELRRKPKGRLARLEYVLIWISEKRPINRNCMDGLGTQAI